MHSKSATAPTISEAKILTLGSVHDTGGAVRFNMPNHCFNKLTVTGPRNAVELFKAVCYDPERKHEISFNKLVPMPPLVNFTTSPKRDEGEWTKLFQALGVEDEWYLWACANWGTKWDAYDQEETEPPILCKDYKHREEQENVKKDTTQVSAGFKFATAWGPPDIWITKVAKLFSMLKFQLVWREEGGDCGRILLNN